MRTRAERRAHLARMKAKAKRVYFYNDPENAIKLADHLKCCSGPCCSNGRRWHGPHISELRQFQE